MDGRHRTHTQSQDRPSTRRGAIQARHRDIIDNDLQARAEAKTSDAELAAALEPALFTAAHEVLCDTEINGPLVELAQAIATESTAAVVGLLRARESGEILGSIDLALRAGMTAAQALAAMGAALDERMPLDGWRAPRTDTPEPLAAAHVHIEDARHALTVAQAILVGCSEVADNGLGHGVQSIRGPRGPYRCDCKEIDAHIALRTGGAA